MGLKERLQKELDLLLEKIRFGRYVVFGIMSGIVGILFGMTQNKIYINLGVIALLAIGLFGIIISIMRLNNLANDYKINLELLEKEE